MDHMTPRAPRVKLTLPHETWRRVRVQAYEEGITASSLADRLLSWALDQKAKPPGISGGPLGQKEIQGELRGTWTTPELHEVSLMEATPGNIAAGTRPGVVVQDSKAAEIRAGLAINNEVGPQLIPPIVADYMRAQGFDVPEGPPAPKGSEGPEVPTGPSVERSSAAPKPGPGRVAAAGRGKVEAKPNRSTMGTTPAVDGITSPVFRPVPKPGKKP